jgi:hypothetical protein
MTSITTCTEEIAVCDVGATRTVTGKSGVPVDVADGVSVVVGVGVGVSVGQVTGHGVAVLVFVGV